MNKQSYEKDNELVSLMDHFSTLFNERIVGYVLTNDFGRKRYNSIYNLHITREYLRLVLTSSSLSKQDWVFYLTSGELFKNGELLDSLHFLEVVNQINKIILDMKFNRLAIFQEYYDPLTNQRSLENQGGIESESSFVPFLDQNQFLPIRELTEHELNAVIGGSGGGVMPAQRPDQRGPNFVGPVPQILIGGPRRGSISKKRGGHYNPKAININRVKGKGLLRRPGFLKFGVNSKETQAVRRGLEMTSGHLAGKASQAPKRRSSLTSSPRPQAVVVLPEVSALLNGKKSVQINPGTIQEKLNGYLKINKNHISVSIQSCTIETSHITVTLETDSGHEIVCFPTTLQSKSLKDEIGYKPFERAVKIHVKEKKRDLRTEFNGFITQLLEAAKDNVLSDTMPSIDPKENAGERLKANFHVIDMPAIIEAIPQCPNERKMEFKPYQEEDGLFHIFSKPVEIDGQEINHVCIVGKVGEERVYKVLPDPKRTLDLTYKIEKMTRRSLKSRFQLVGELSSTLPPAAGFDSTEKIERARGLGMWLMNRIGGGFIIRHSKFRLGLEEYFSAMQFLYRDVNYSLSNEIEAQELAALKKAQKEAEGNTSADEGETNPEQLRAEEAQRAQEQVRSMLDQASHVMRERFGVMKKDISDSSFSLNGISTQSVSVLDKAMENIKALCLPGTQKSPETVMKELEEIEKKVEKCMEETACKIRENLNAWVTEHSSSQQEQINRSRTVMGSLTRDFSSIAIGISDLRRTASVKSMVELVSAGIDSADGLQGLYLEISVLEHRLSLYESNKGTTAKTELLEAVEKTKASINGFVSEHTETKDVRLKPIMDGLRAYLLLLKAKTRDLFQEDQSLPEALRNSQAAIDLVEKESQVDTDLRELQGKLNGPKKGIVVSVLDCIFVSVSDWRNAFFQLFQQEYDSAVYEQLMQDFQLILRRLAFAMLNAQELGSVTDLTVFDSLRENLFGLWNIGVQYGKSCDESEENDPEARYSNEAALFRKISNLSKLEDPGLKYALAQAAISGSENTSALVTNVLERSSDASPDERLVELMNMSKRAEFLQQIGGILNKPGTKKQVIVYDAFLDLGGSVHLVINKDAGGQAPFSKRPRIQSHKVIMLSPPRVFTSSGSRNLGYRIREALGTQRLKHLATIDVYTQVYDTLIQLLGKRIENPDSGGCELVDGRPQDAAPSIAGMSVPEPPRVKPQDAALPATAVRVPETPRIQPLAALEPPQVQQPAEVSDAEYNRFLVQVVIPELDRNKKELKVERVVYEFDSQDAESRQQALQEAKKVTRNAFMSAMRISEVLKLTFANNPMYVARKETLDVFFDEQAAAKALGHVSDTLKMMVFGKRGIALAFADKAGNNKEAKTVVSLSLGLTIRYLTLSALGFTDMQNTQEYFKGNPHSPADRAGDCHACLEPDYPESHLLKKLKANVGSYDKLLSAKAELQGIQAKVYDELEVINSEMKQERIRRKKQKQLIKEKDSLSIKISDLDVRLTEIGNLMLTLRTDIAAALGSDDMLKLVTDWIIKTIYERDFMPLVETIPDQEIRRQILRMLKLFIKDEAKAVSDFSKPDERGVFHFGEDITGRLSDIFKQAGWSELI
ncbi:hypothetical protein ACFL96_01250 [Thermoproteota archaeon]